MRTAGANEIKKFLKMRLEDSTIYQEEKKQAVVLGIPGATKADD
jgi:glutaredoxin-related protein